jgi:hypothetical protein
MRKSCAVGCLLTCMMMLLWVTDEQDQTPGIHFQYQNNAQLNRSSTIIDYETIEHI